jgi:hypothetical protein
VGDLREKLDEGHSLHRESTAAGAADGTRWGCMRWPMLHTGH